jgi:hypothetical protein
MDFTGNLSTKHGFHHEDVIASESHFVEKSLTNVRMRMFDFTVSKGHGYPLVLNNPPNKILKQIL